MTSNPSGTMPAVQRTMLAGIPTFWASTGGDYTGLLLLGVGARDLEPVTAGLHHLVEHLVMRRVGRVAIDHNAESTLDSILFYASGDQAAVADFLSRVGDALSSLAEVTDRELELERATVATEIGTAGVYAAPGPFSLRWGATGLGVGDLNHAALPSLSTEDVRAFARRWVIDANARLVFSGPPPEHLSVTLPTGQAPERAVPATVDGPLPALARVPTSGITLSFIARAPRHVRHVTAAVLEELLLQRLRHDQGKVYDVDLSTYRADADSSVWVVSLDPDDQHAAAIAVDAVQVVNELASAGPEPALLEHARATVGNLMSSGRRRFAWLLASAAGDPRGEETPDWETYAPAVAAVTADQVRELITSQLPTMLLTLPPWVDVPSGAWSDLEAAGLGRWRVPYRTFSDMPRSQMMADLMSGGTRSTGVVASALRPRASVHQGRMFGPMRGEQLWIGPRQVAIPSLDARVRIEDLVLVGTDDDGDTELVTSAGGAIIVNPRHFRRAARAWATFLSNVPPEIVRDKRGVPGGDEIVEPDGDVDAS